MATTAPVKPAILKPMKAFITVNGPGVTCPMAMTSMISLAQPVVVVHKLLLQQGDHGIAPPMVKTFATKRTMASFGGSI